MSSPALTAYFDQQRRQITDAIRRYGCWNTYVSDDAECACCAATRRKRTLSGGNPRPRVGAPEWPAFCYTTGLFGVGHPELLVYALPPEASCELLNLFVDQIRAAATSSRANASPSTTASSCSSKRCRTRATSWFRPTTTGSGPQRHRCRCCN